MRSATWLCGCYGYRAGLDANLCVVVCSRISCGLHDLRPTGNSCCAFFSPAAPTVRLPYRVKLTASGLPIPPSPSTFTSPLCIGLRVTHPASCAERMCSCVIERCFCGVETVRLSALHIVSIRLLGLNCPQTQWISRVRGPQVGPGCT